MRSSVNVNLLLLSILVPRVPDTLVFKFVVSKFMIYRAMCEHLETIDCIEEARECFHGMMVELELMDGDNTPHEQVEWVSGA